MVPRGRWLDQRDTTEICGGPASWRGFFIVSPRLESQRFCDKDADAADWLFSRERLRSCALAIRREAKYPSAGMGASLEAGVDAGAVH